MNNACENKNKEVCCRRLSWCDPLLLLYFDLFAVITVSSISSSCSTCIASNVCRGNIFSSCFRDESFWYCIDVPPPPPRCRCRRLGLDFGLCWSSSLLERKLALFFVPWQQPYIDHTSILFDAITFTPSFLGWLTGWLAGWLLPTLTVVLYSLSPSPPPRVWLWLWLWPWPRWTAELLSVRNIRLVVVVFVWLFVFDHEQQLR